MPSKKRKKYKLLFDEGLPLPNTYPTINNFHNIVHIAETKNRSASDDKVYALANKEGRIPVVFNTKDFKRLISSNSISVISLSTNIANQQADLKIHKALYGLNIQDLKGCLVSVSNSGITVKRIIDVEEV